MGFRDSVGIDHTIPKQVVSPVLRLDLLEPDHVQMVISLIDSSFCVYIHLAPPCGTASRARDIFRRGESQPPPVRSAACPDGLRSLSGDLKLRVDKANTLYAAAGRIFAHCIRQGKMVSCENPGRSYFWDTSMWREAVAGLSFHETWFHNCQHGGDRAKLTRLAHNVPLLCELALLCPGESADHRHEPWNRAARHFATSEEKVYPRLLCQRVADVILRASAALGYAAQPLSLAPGTAIPLHEAQAVAGLQPAGRRLPPLVPEYKQIVVVRSAAPLFAGVRKLEDAATLPPEAFCSADLRRLPAGTRVLRHSVVGVAADATQDPTLADDIDEQPLPDGNMDPEEFSHYALHLSHTASDEAWRDCIRHLCDLKSEPPSRGGMGTNEFSWSCGAYFHANKVGLRTNTNQHPNVCKLLCECVRRMAPGHPFTSLMLGKDLVGRVHADKNNAPGLPNAVLKISSFEQGGLWVESPNGTTPCPDQGHDGSMGNVLEFEDRRIIFDPSRKRCQSAWSGDSRITLVAFSIRDFHKVPGDQQRHLRNLGFAFPDFCADPCPRPSCDTHENQQRHQGDLGIAFPDLVVDSSPCAARCPTAGPVAATPPLSSGHPSCDTPENQQRHQGDLGIAFPDSVVDSSPCAARCPTAGPVAATPPLSLGHAPPPKDSSKDQPASKHGHHRVHKVALGIPWDPHEFVEQALRAGHPRSLLDGLPSRSRDNLDRMAGMSLHEIGARRTECLRKWVGKARELDDEEQTLRDGMPLHCTRVLGRKRLVLFQAMLEECGHEDVEIAKDIAKGFDLSGAIPKNPAFRPKLSAASLPVADLHGSAAVMRGATLLSTRSSGDQELDDALMDATEKEVAKGWLRGPIDSSELGPTAIISRRFGIWQNGKCRPIDDFKASGVNATTSAEDSVTVHTADVIAATIAYRLKHDSKCRRFGGLEMKSYDLHKAYKNLPLSASAVEEAYLAVYNPRTGGAEVYEQCVLPFGARASVHSFCRTSLGIWAIGVTMLLLMWSVYYDDFVGGEIPPLSRLFDVCAETLFMLLGWDTSPDKPSTFGGIAKVLGLEFDLRESQLGRFYMRNTTSRCEELRDTISIILERGTLARKECERLRGRLQFASNQVAGKKAGLAFKVLSKHLRTRQTSVDDELRAALLFLRDSFLEGPPRALSANILHLWHVYVDASCDNDKIGLGGVLISDTGVRVGYFSEWATAELRQLVGPSSKNPIFECECLAVLMCFRVWGCLLRSCNVVVFSDNEGTRACMIKGASDNSVGMRLVDATHNAIDSACCVPWFERVNTASNIADDPSRGTVDESLGRRFETDALSIAQSALFPWG